MFQKKNSLRSFWKMPHRWSSHGLADTLTFLWSFILNKDLGTEETCVVKYNPVSVAKTYL